MAGRSRWMREIRPSEAAFVRLARRGNVIPVWGELVGDLETPVGAYRKLDQGRLSFLLESVEGEEKVARFSFLGSRPSLLVTSTGREVEITQFGDGRPRRRRFQTSTDPLAEVQRLMRGMRYVPVAGLPRFTGGLVGYMGYDMARFFERLPAHQIRDLQVPDLMLMLADSMVVFDHAQHKLLVIVHALTEGRSPRAAYREALAKVRGLAATMQRPVRRTPVRGRQRTRGRVRSNIGRAEFTRMVKAAKRCIRAGEIIQVVLSQRFERTLSCEPFEVYRALRSLNPSPYMFFLRLGTFSLVGSSPEMLVRCEEGRLETRPIAGTRPRGRTPQAETRLIQQLTTSPKERAEHVMLVDLGRNDLGRVAQPGSVQTSELMAVERYSHVLHLVSGVSARLTRGRTAYDVLRNTFPAGTVSGAPKVRAMELIAELERYARGPYAGAVGYVSFSGNLDTCITIRTILIQGRRAFVQAGAGIVADSRPQREYQETVNKAQGMLRAIELAERGC